MTNPTYRAGKHGEHDWLSPDYVDKWIAEWSKNDKRRIQLRMVAAGLPFPRQQRIKLLDVGSGWGPLSEQILMQWPNATITLIDFSPRMLEQARSRLAQYSSRTRYEERDLTDPDWWRGLDEPFDSVVTSHAIHNLNKPELIKKVYADILHLLKPRGCFVNLEIVFSASPLLAAIEERISADLQGSDPDEINVEPSNHDPRSLRVQLEWMR
jgi:ubiquinone/menaquinone biosynthesis C-methylase UbiE